MQGIVILSVLLFAGAALAIPVDIADSGKHRWTLTPDGDGKMHLLDLNPYEGEPQPAFNADQDVFFVLFTRRNPTAGQRISTPASVASSQWSNAAASTRFIIHGWNNNHNSNVNVAIQRGLLARADTNVVRVDWGVGANNPNYIASRNQVANVGAVVARFIDMLHLNGFLVNFNRLNLIGHSLGAHIAGHAGKRTTRGRVHAIFGLDPAGPLFSVADSAGRFHSTDALYTEMIATNAGVLGFDQPMAHANFYPNWGSQQPGCGTDVGGSCAHSRVVPLYEESITSTRFVARRCANYGQITSRNCPTGQGTATMGGDFHRTLTGVFFLETNANAPFARG